MMMRKIKAYVQHVLKTKLVTKNYSHLIPSLPLSSALLQIKLTTLLSLHLTCTLSLQYEWKKTIQIEIQHAMHNMFQTNIVL